jgi:hypothetical protein
LLRDIHELARAYHWREPDVLQLSHARRKQYLALIAEDHDAELVRDVLGGE